MRLTSRFTVHLPVQLGNTSILKQINYMDYLHGYTYFSSYIVKPMWTQASPKKASFAQPRPLGGKGVDGEEGEGGRGWGGGGGLMGGGGMGGRRRRKTLGTRLSSHTPKASNIFPSGPPTQSIST